MNVIDAKTVVENLQWRYATKKFDRARKIDGATWSALEQALILSPSSFGLQPWKFYVVSDSALRERLRGVSWNQPQIVDASHLVVLCGKEEVDGDYIEKYVDSICRERGVPRENLAGYRDMMFGALVPPKFDIPTWTSRQVYIALGNLLTTAAMMGVDACPMEGFEAGAYDEILGIKGTGYRSMVLCTLGYRSSEDSLASQKKIRLSADEVIVRM